jgi:hypothetical protein
MEACPLEAHDRRFRGSRYSPPGLPTLQIGLHQKLLKAGREILVRTKIRVAPLIVHCCQAQPTSVNAPIRAPTTKKQWLDSG